MTVPTTPWNVQDYLKTPEECTAFIEAAFEEAGDDPAFILKSLADVIRAQGSGNIAKATGINQEYLEHAFDDGSASCADVVKVLKALGLRLCVKRPPSDTTQTGT